MSGTLEMEPIFSLQIAAANIFMSHSLTIKYPPISYKMCNSAVTIYHGPTFNVYFVTQQCGQAEAAVATAVSDPAALLQHSESDCSDCDRKLYEINLF